VPAALLISLAPVASRLVTSSRVPPSW
jgi:hypothetical protein